MLKQFTLGRLVREQRAARLRSPRVAESMFLSSWMNGALIQMRLFRRWLVGSQRMKALLTLAEIRSRQRLTRTETTLLVVLLYLLAIMLLSSSISAI